MKKIFVLIPVLLLFSCFPYVYYDQNEVVLKDIDIDKTIEIGKMELQDGGFTEVLTFWAIRDQIFYTEQAKKINDIYLENINKITSEFGIWHFAWAVSDIYRNGSEDIKKEIQPAYNDAVKRPITLKKFNKIANEHINGKKIYMGNIHELGKYYAKTHLIVSGNKEYIQSIDDYKKIKEKDKKWLNKIKL